MNDGHDEASGSSSDVDDTIETEVLVFSSSEPASGYDKSIVSKTDLLFTVGSSVPF
jgi:hypothetical protein